MPLSSPNVPLERRGAGFDYPAISMNATCTIGQETVAAKPIAGKQ